MQARPSLPIPGAFDSERPPLGIPPGDAHGVLQQETFKELINKFAWALGSTYGTRYANKRSTARVYAIKMARAIVRDHGYPASIAKEN